MGQRQTLQARFSLLVPFSSRLWQIGKWRNGVVPIPIPRTRATLGYGTTHVTPTTLARPCFGGVCSSWAHGRRCQPILVDGRWRVGHHIDAILCIHPHDGAATVGTPAPDLPRLHARHPLAPSPLVPTLCRRSPTPQ